MSTTDYLSQKMSNASRFFEEDEGFKATMVVGWRFAKSQQISVECLGKTPFAGQGWRFPLTIIQLVPRSVSVKEPGSNY